MVERRSPRPQLCELGLEPRAFGHEVGDGMAHDLLRAARVKERLQGLLGCLLAVEAGLGRDLSSRPRGCCAPYGQGGRCCWMLPPPSVSPAVYGGAESVTWIEKVSLVPGSPPSVTVTMKCTGLP